MFSFFKSVDNYEPIIITATEQGKLKGLISALIIKDPGFKGIFSRRCIVWGGPICIEAEFADPLIIELTNFVKSKTIYTEFRNLFDISILKNLFLRHGFNYENRINYLVKIESLEINQKMLNENRRRQIKKSLKTGCEIIQAENIEQVKLFYSILKELYETKVKLPLPAFDFFEKFFFQNRLGKYLLVKYDGKIIGGIMCPIFKDTIYEWYICGLDSEYKDQSPSVVATWAAIEFAVINKLKYFDFMGAGKPDSQYGVREFKSKFGGQEVQYGRYRKINKPITYKFGYLGLKILKYLKF